MAPKTPSLFIGCGHLDTLTDLLPVICCDDTQLWDVTEDQEAVDLIRSTSDAQEASKVLLDYAMKNYSTDNLSVMVVRFRKF